VDKAIRQPTLIDLAKAIGSVKGVEGTNITVTEIDLETVGTVVTVEGNQIDFPNLVKAIESTGAVLHSVDEIATGERLVEAIKRRR
jgi:hypothetical protein